MAESSNVSAATQEGVDISPLDRPLACIVQARVDQGREDDAGNVVEPFFARHTLVLRDLHEAASVVETKEATPLISPIMIEGERRKLANIVEISALAFDVDEGEGEVRARYCTPERFERIVERFRADDVAFVAYTSHSHGLKGEHFGRYRVMLPFDLPMRRLPGETDSAGLLTRYARLRALILRKYGLMTCVGTAKDLTRLWYLPSCPQSRLHLAKSWLHDGKALSVGGLFAEADRAGIRVDPVRVANAVFSNYTQAPSAPTREDVEALAGALDAAVPKMHSVDRRLYGLVDAGKALASGGGRHAALYQFGCLVGRTGFETCAETVLELLKLSDSYDAMGCSDDTDYGWCRHIHNGLEHGALDAQRKADEEALRTRLLDKYRKRTAILSGTPEASPAGDAQEGESQEPEVSPDELPLTFPVSVVDKKTGSVLPVNRIENTEALLDHYRAHIGYDEMTRRPFYILNGEMWGPNDAEAQIREWGRSRGYQPPLEVLTEQIRLIRRRNRVHPIKRWIESREWDGEDRFPALAASVHLQPWVDVAFAHLLLRRWLRSAAAAADGGEEGVKAEGVLVLQGQQGNYKTSWFNSLAPLGIVDGMSLDPDKPDSVRNCTEAWICELGEFASTLRKADIERLKAFFSQKMDRIRLPYERHSEDYPRRTVFCASENHPAFLKDKTGNRRYYTLAVESCDPKHGIDMQQLWAQMMFEVRSGELHWLTREEVQQLSGLNDKHIEIEPLEDLIDQHFEIDFDGGDLAQDVILQPLKDKVPEWTLKETRLVTGILRRRGLESRSSHGVRYWPLRRRAKAATVAPAPGKVSFLDQARAKAAARTGETV